MKRHLWLLALTSAVAFAQTAGPTPAALASCAGRAEYAGCSVELDDGAHEGICLKAPRDEAPSCMPRPVPMPEKPEVPPVTASR